MRPDYFRLPTTGILPYCKDWQHRQAENGFAAALERQKRETPPRIKIDGETEAKIVALICSNAPEGYILASKVVALGITESVSHTAIADCLKKTKLNHGYKNSGASQNHQQNL
ncbi:MAG: helix-turn-helix domain-containing protein [Oscillospiraceae bacterium]|nr:helix-turn-helix domain-containing protein [Oscillospiraceae bacterium]